MYGTLRNLSIRTPTLTTNTRPERLSTVYNDLFTMVRSADDDEYRRHMHQHLDIDQIHVDK
jgi:DNA-binding FadR family transcriptional regulator